MTFNEWFYSKPHRKKYTPETPAYLAAQEAWEAAHEACAKVCEVRYMGDNNREDMEARRCAAAIRARGQPDAKVTHLKEWARDRLARHGIQTDDDDGNPSF
jgi:hypothetical protein